jgi:hypothetical protein
VHLFTPRRYTLFQPSVLLYNYITVPFAFSILCHPTSKMLYSKLACAVAFSVGALANPAPSPARGGGGGGGGAAADATALTLDPAAVQTGSASSGIGSIGSEAGQAASQTSNNNFINFCAGKTLTNGLQVVGGSCNGIGKHLGKAILNTANKS